MPSRVELYVQTLRHLRARQLAWYAYRRLSPSRPVAPILHVPPLRRLAFEPFVPAKGGFTPPRTFTFLNHTETFGERIAWQGQSVPRLWLYNLHYFDCAADPSIRGHEIDDLIRDWIDSNPQGTVTAWEPYPLSLRVVNWIKFHLSRGGSRNAPWLASLSTQLRWLSRHCEHHLGANHLFKNAKALVFGGLFFEGDEAARWLSLGARLLHDELREQVLADGGHYERSFMYHAIVTEDVLDLVNLASRNANALSADVTLALSNAGKKMVDFLLSSLHPDGEIALFNDAAFGIAPHPSALADYLARLTGERREVEEAFSLINHSASGYFGYRSADELFLIDCGEIGPDYQPGHAHCDTLSFELSFSGQRVIVDSGTFDYEATELRHYLRSTAAHNTVRIDGAEQSQIWAAFRVGKRARPISAQIERSGDSVRFEGAHNGFAHLSGAPIHRRIIEAEPGKRWTIRDHVEGRGSHLVESFIHIHPDLKLSSDGENWILTKEDRPFARILPRGGTAQQQSAIYCSQFGIREPSQCLVITVRADLPIDLGFVIERV